MSYVYAISDAVAYEDGKRLALSKDQIWDADDPFVKARPDLFTEVPKKVNRTTPAPVEAATAAPGEKRGARRGG